LYEIDFEKHYFIISNQRVFYNQFISVSTLIKAKVEQTPPTGTVNVFIAYARNGTIESRCFSPAIIDRDIFNLAQDIVKKRRFEKIGVSKVQNREIKQHPISGRMDKTLSFNSNKKTRSLIFSFFNSTFLMHLFQ
jgi:hypothetical protein